MMVYMSQKCAITWHKCTRVIAVVYQNIHVPTDSKTIYLDIFLTAHLRKIALIYL